MIELGDPDGNTFDRHLRLLDCASVLRAIIRIDANGKYAILADRYQGHRFNSPNDVVMGPDGAIFFTDPHALDLPKGQKQEIPFQGVLLRLDDEGNVTLLVNDMSQPNGLAFSPDGKRFYVDDSEQKNIRVFDFSSDGVSINKHYFGEEKEPGGVPDGMKVDESGNLFVVGPKGIWMWDANGKHLGTIVLPEQKREPGLGRQGLQYALHNCRHIGIPDTHKGARICAIPEKLELAKKEIAMDNVTTRREIFGRAKKALAAAGIASQIGPAMAATPAHGNRNVEGEDYYDKLGVTKIINAAGTYTILTASTMPPSVQAAVAIAAKHPVRLLDLQRLAGEYLAKRLHSEAAMVTAGSIVRIDAGHGSSA